MHIHDPHTDSFDEPRLDENGLDENGDDNSTHDTTGRERIAKRLARAGVASRRDIEKMIAQGRVLVNGQKLLSAAVLVGPDDKIIVDQKEVGIAETVRLFRYHKPAGLVTSARDEKGRRTVFDALPEGLPRLNSVGRLDLTSEGLLLLTNDGGLQRWLELPITGWVRRYRARAFGFTSQASLDKLKDGVRINGVQYGPIEATLDSVQGRNAWITVSLTEGKNREVRRVLDSLGLVVNRLIRLSYGPFQLGRLTKGQVEEVSLAVLREQCAGYFHTAGIAIPNPDRKGWAKAKPKPKRGQKPASKTTPKAKS